MPQDHQPNPRDAADDWEPFRRNWTQLTGALHQRWKRLSEEQLARIDGNRELLLDALQSTYDLSPENARTELQAFIDENRVCFDNSESPPPSTPIAPDPWS